LVSIAALLIPLSRIVPPLYTFRIRSRIFRWYGTLRDIEERAGASDRSEADTRALIDELAELDTRVERLPVPLSHAEELYALRSHIRLVQRRLGEG
ncbi:MAG TPA: C4-dicarboxylate ABC transporter substrate-binding protein, partial [Burkholderiaceae bacterium]|nr:C4-dicarboxylate ABC transporter substrate-binding protein [Burkholderiaceae bacterium]